VFTGLVEEVGRVVSVTPESTGVAVRIGAREVLQGSRVGDSIAANGCCLTVTALDGTSFSAHAGTETVARTTVRQWAAGRAVNLERALLPTSRLGGHFVQGHVDGVGQVLAAVAEGETVRWSFTLPEALAPQVVEKGSIAVDGISLTVTRVDASGFQVAVIPHTQANTALGTLRPGDGVNLETDVLAKYVTRILALAAPQSSRVTEDFLREHGFV
jgi:riboflavin synthase